MGPRRDTVFHKIVRGYFPVQTVKNMNRERLERCVVDLVIYSSDSKETGPKGFLDLYEELCLNKIERPQWWPSDRAISQEFTEDGKCVMELLRFLVYKCYVFFKKPSTDWNDNEIAVLLKRKGIPFEIRRQTKPRYLLRKNVGTQCSWPYMPKETFPELHIPLVDIKANQRPLSQDEFLNHFMLQRTSNLPVNHAMGLPTKSYHSVKFHTCSGIPFSSDLGIELMKRDGHSCPDVTIMKSLEKRERYTNRELVPASSSQYTVNFNGKNRKDTRNYRFPKRQFHQHPGNVNHQKKQLLCKPLKVLLERLDLSLIQKHTNKRNFTVKTVKKQRRKISSIIRKPLNELKRKDIFVVLNKM